MDLYRHIYEAGRFMDRKTIKFANIVKDMKDEPNEKWFAIYQKIAKDFFNEDYERDNQKAKDVLSTLNG
jgi:hypothetical protein